MHEMPPHSETISPGAPSLQIWKCPLWTPQWHCNRTILSAAHHWARISLNSISLLYLGKTAPPKIRDLKTNSHLVSDLKHNLVTKIHVAQTSLSLQQNALHVLRCQWARVHTLFSVWIIIIISTCSSMVLAINKRQVLGSFLPFFLISYF